MAVREFPGTTGLRRRARGNVSDIGRGVERGGERTFVEAVLEIFHVFQLLVCGLLAAEGIDFLAEFGPDVGALGQLEP
jgi:hypothetical protein